MNVVFLYDLYKLNIAIKQPIHNKSIFPRSKAKTTGKLKAPDNEKRTDFVVE